VFPDRSMPLFFISCTHLMLIKLGAKHPKLGVHASSVFWKIGQIPGIMVWIYGAQYFGKFEPKSPEPTETPFLMIYIYENKNKIMLIIT